ncbi:MAG: MerR family transcriptional regulator [Coriobacteriales bacterium]|jgi:DNA-binding transcriptional MerR regulator|nr:MerR family transcriptional regulator [Coriobacteriales bacterium]
MDDSPHKEDHTQAATYRINELAQLAGVSTRTLRWFERLGLLAPRRAQNGYRLYGRRELDRLQHILFYREIGVPLKQAAILLDAEDFDDLAALEEHLSSLKTRREHIDGLIHTVTRTIEDRRKESVMSDEQRFEGFKKKLIEDNERRFGAEARARYGDAEVDASNARVAGMTQEQHAHMEQLTARLHEALKAAYDQGAGDPQGARAKELCELHKQWLCIFWERYSPEAHRGVTQMYVDDPRFTAYYDALAPGSAVFLRDAVHAWLDGCEAKAD